MKAILEFDLDKVEDSLAHRRAINATKAYLTLFSLEQELRKIDKYTDSDVVEISKMRDLFYNLLQDHDINLDDLG